MRPLSPHTRAALAALILAFAPAVQAQTERSNEAEPTQQSLYDRLGGLMPISVVVSDFIDVLVPDPVLNANPAIDAARQRVPAPYLKYHVTSLVCQVTGGPCQYQGRNMKDAHAHLNIGEREWEQMVVLFKDVLARHKVPERETRELLEIVASTKGDIVVATAAK